MVWFSIANPSGRGGWQFDPDGAAHIIRGNHYQRELIRRSSVIRRDHGFFMPTTTEVETDFSDIRRSVVREARVMVDRLDADLANDPRELFEFLVKLREDGESAGDAWAAMMQEATRETMKALSTNIGKWETAGSIAKLTRDVAAGALFIGATVLSGGAALAVGGAATGLTFTGNTQDNLASNQKMRQALGNAAISTSFAVVTNLLIPKGLAVAGRGMTGVNAAGKAARNLTTGENVVLGLVSVQANVGGDMIKTALTADAASGAVAAGAKKQFERQLGARTAFEITAMMLQSFLAARGIPASPFLQRNADSVASVTGGAIAAVGDRVVAALAAQDAQAAGRGDAPSPDLDLLLSRLAQTMKAEAYVREVAMRPI